MQRYARLFYFIMLYDVALFEIARIEQVLVLDVWLLALVIGLTHLCRGAGSPRLNAHPCGLTRTSGWVEGEGERGLKNVGLRHTQAEGAQPKPNLEYRSCRGGGVSHLPPQFSVYNMLRNSWKTSCFSFMKCLNNRSRGYLITDQHWWD